LGFCPRSLAPVCVFLLIPIVALLPKPSAGPLISVPSGIRALESLNDILDHLGKRPHSLAIFLRKRATSIPSCIEEGVAHSSRRPAALCCPESSSFFSQRFRVFTCPSFTGLFWDRAVPSSLLCFRALLPADLNSIRRAPS